MIGALIGDVVGSIYETSNVKKYNFPLYQTNCKFTDDTVLTLAIAKALIECKKKNDFKKIKEYYLSYVKNIPKRYPNVGYGQRFQEWVNNEKSKPYYSYGNGAAMRVSPIGYVFNNINDVRKQAKLSAKITHNHPDGIKGAEAVACAVFMARNNCKKEEIRIFLEKKYGYKFNFTLNNLHKNYKFEISAKKTVPQAIFAFFESNDFISAIRNAIFIGGDSDTIGCIVGGISEAYYKNIPDEVIYKLLNYLDGSLKKIIEEFYIAFNLKLPGAVWFQNKI